MNGIQGASYSWSVLGKSFTVHLVTAPWDNYISMLSSRYISTNVLLSLKRWPFSSRFWWCSSSLKKKYYFYFTILALSTWILYSSAVSWQGGSGYSWTELTLCKITFRIREKKDFFLIVCTNTTLARRKAQMWDSPLMYILSLVYHCIIGTHS